MVTSIIKEDILHRFVISDVEMIIDSSIASGGFVENTKTIDKPGYFPLGIVSFNVSGSGSAVCMPRSANITSYGAGTVTVYGGLRNVGSSAATTARLWVRILWMKI